MLKDERSYIAIDLKSFYASVECVSRGLNPLKTNLLVADLSRTEKTICLAVSPTLKKCGIGGRARLFEVVQKVKEENAKRKSKNGGKEFTGKSYDYCELEKNPSLELDYVIAPPQMAKYMQVSTQIYNIYLKYISPDDIHVYSIDEVFIDVTSYFKTYKITANELAIKMISQVLKETGITATVGIGTNMYLCKVAMDIVAKHIPLDENGFCVAYLDEMSYRKLLWSHRPLTDFWRVGRGYTKKLEEKGIFTMGDIARCSLGGEKDYYNENLLYKMFGINAELLIDHAWGYEPCTIEDVKAYKPETKSISLGQVLKCPYTFEKGKLILMEMTDLLVLDLVEKGFATDQMVLTVGYDVENISDYRSYDEDKISTDYYGRKVPKSAHGTINLKNQTSSTKMILKAVLELYCKIVDKNLTIRRMYVVANNVVLETDIKVEENIQLDLFTDYDTLNKKIEEEKKLLIREKEIQKALLKIKKKYGKNSILKGMNFKDGATTIERNGQVGGHKA